MGDLREPKGGLTEERPPVPSLSKSSSFLNPSPYAIGPERWARAEKATRKIISQVRPTAVSEQRRREVIDYVQRLIRGRLGCEVFPYGSVPLKTYLPDGDIDLTAFGGLNFEEALAKDMESVLKGEDQNRSAEFVVKDVQLVRAEVKLVKCIVQNIVVDISFNQIGGLCTLCFLEQVDRFIGKDHLFKRSIILIKAWCYYESRILGAHHGLISTYALETMVLYIFHLFHSTLNGPLAVLHKFLDYFSKFDWDKYCISLRGPVRISLLPKIVAETPENGGGDLLLSNDFIRYCVDTFSVPLKGVDTNSRKFPEKHLNIVDPLKENNNLGRSVSRGNFYRIRSAFNYGARKLGAILLLPEDTIADELVNFFSNTLDRHGSGRRPDVQNPMLISTPNGFSPAFPVSETESCQEEKAVPECNSTSCIGTTEDWKFNDDISFSDGISCSKTSGREMKFSIAANVQQSGCMKVNHPPVLSESDGFGKESALSGCRFSGDAKDIAISRFQAHKMSNDHPRVSHQHGEENISPPGVAHHAPHLYFSNSVLDNGKVRCKNSELQELENCEETYFSRSVLDNGKVRCRNSELQESENCESKVSSGFVRGSDSGSGDLIGCGQEKHALESKHEVKSLDESKWVASENPHPLNNDRSSRSSFGNSDSFYCLSDLTGDYDSHFNCLQYGRWCYEHVSSMSSSPMPPPLPSHFLSNNSWAMQRSLFKRNGFSHGGTNGTIPSPAYYSINQLLMPGMAFALEEMPRPRGTGTYFPNTNRPPQGYRPSVVKGRNQAPLRSPRKNGRAMIFTETNMFEQRSHESSQLQIPVDQGGRGKPSPFDVHPSVSPREKVHQYANGLVPHSEGVVEFGSVGHVSLAAPLLESSMESRIASSLPQASTQCLPSPEGRKPKLVLDMDQLRVAVPSSYHLKEDDFPPLSV